jgi:tRNA-2-methylthio-N6-dimethylallyladenosine synthase
MRKYYILTFGCQMNKHDSERVASLLNSLNLEITDSPAEADVLVANTCSVRKTAEDRVFGCIKNWQKFREKRQNLIIAVTGCMPGRDKNGILREKIPGADLFFPIEELVLLPARLKSLNPDLFGEHSDNLENYLDIFPAHKVNYKISTTIQTGCDNFCSYCIVPYARDREKNRPIKSVISEMRSASMNGCKETMLLGQVVNNYKISDRENIAGNNPFKDKDDFAALLWEVNQISGIERINFMAADPQYFNKWQISALSLPKQMNYLHLPAQSGDNEVLRKMNRKYTREYYIDLIKKIRAERPEIAIGTDFIVGFCGETDEQFQNTLDLYRQCDFDISFHSMYSERSGTAASKAFKDDVPREIKKQRWEAIQNLMEEITERKNRKFLGQTVSVLVEKCEDGVCSGNSSEMKLTQFKGDSSLVGQVIKVKITRPDTWLLRGEMV